MERKFPRPVVSGSLTRETFTAADIEGAADTNLQVLLHMNGTTTTYVDEKAHTVTAYGNATQQATTKKFGAAASLFDANDGSYVKVSNSSDFNIGASDFTIDFWFYHAGTPSDPSYLGAFGNMIILLSGSGEGSKIKVYNTDTTDQLFGGTYTDGAWNHLAIVRSSGTVKLYCNGVAGIGYTHTYSYANADIHIGHSTHDDSWPMNGYVDEFRMVVGRAEWTSNFTPKGSEYTGNLFSSQTDFSTTTGINPSDDVQVIANNVVRTDYTRVVKTFTFATGIPEGHVVKIEIASAVNTITH